MRLFWRHKNEKGAILIWFYLLITVLLITGGSLYALAFQESRIVAIEQARNNAFYLAEAGLDRKLEEIRNSNTTNIASTNINAPNPASGSYSVTYDVSAKQVQSTGTFGGISRTVTAVTAAIPPPGAKAAITSEGDISFSGSIKVDGRNYDASGNLTGDPGTYGASAGGTVTQSGSSDIGGNGFEPASPANPAAIEENATGNTYTTPEELLGVAVGSLDSYKTSTPPATPFNGIVYFTGDSWIAPDLGDDSNPSTGILIVHNATNNALLKNIHGTFKGLIIADDLVQINGDAVVLGALIAKTSTGTTGNGSAVVKYSLEILETLPAGNVDLLSWEDQQNTAYTYS